MAWVSSPGVRMTESQVGYMMTVTITHLNFPRTWVCNYIHCKVSDEIIYPFPNFNGFIVEIWELISNVSHTFQGMWLLSHTVIMAESNFLMIGVFLNNTREGEIWNVFCEFIIWFVFYICYQHIFKYGTPWIPHVGKSIFTVTIQILNINFAPMCVCKYNRRHTIDDLRSCNTTG